MKATAAKPHAGRAAIVTGAARGIGLVIAERLAADGAQLVLGDADAAGLERSVQALRAAGTRVVGVAGDLSQEAVAQATVDAALREFGRLDILVNNAGGGVILPFLEQTPETLRRTIDRNLWTAIWSCRAALPVMKKQRYGRIVNLGADSVYSGLHAHAAYNAAKGGVHAMCSALAREFGRDGITVNSVAPCAVNTPQLAELIAGDATLHDKFLGVIPLGRAAEMDEVAGFVSYVASEEAGFITGQVLSINGATTTR
jgi:2,3-dihydroxy-2,3-dihydro-p-cumate dehydrogenase